MWCHVDVGLEMLESPQYLEEGPLTHRSRRKLFGHISESRQYLGDCISAKHFGRGLLERFEGVYERVVEGFMEDG